MESKPSHEIEPVSQHCDDNEQFGSRDGRDIENQLPDPALVPNERKMNDDDVYRILALAAMKDKWSVAEVILRKDPSLVRQKISEFGETVLQIAALAGSTGFVLKLMTLMEPDDFELKTNNGNTAFNFAVNSGFIEIVKAMRERNNNLPNIHGLDPAGRAIFPISAAAIYGHKAMVSYLFEVTNLDMLNQTERLSLLEITTHNEMYDVALKIFNKDRKLTTQMLQGNLDVFYILSHKSLVISNQQGKLKRSIEGPYNSPLVLWRKFISATSMVRSRFITWLLPERYILKKQGGLLLEELWAECERSGEDKLLELVRWKKLIQFAAIAGNVEFLAVVIHNHPRLLWEFDREWSVFHYAIFNRQEKVFSLIHQTGGMKNFLLQKYDTNGNNMLHLAGTLGCSNLYNKEKIMLPSFLRVSGAALQMQKEILWFKEVEKLLPPSLHNIKNKAEKTPREVFTEEHNLLLKEGERWMKDTANSCMIVATLIATMVFAAGFTVPGGNNSDTGIPILLEFNGFRVFVISDAVALFSSILSIIMFLSILTSRYAEDDFLVSLPAKLLFGLTTLFVSIVSMLLAFTTAFFLVYSNHTDWEPKLIAACAGIPVALFGCFQYKLWFDVAKSTYWSKFLFRPGKYKLY
ncbi:uncharacterized protein [Solanum tuberosum]|uniref:uncharacterized protein n=1 Tax=Solanum tuberosum TaxID=4113 RepID=UPI000739FE0F|nr:PREDICTED: uncharacterized protein LOC102598038 [Solanum tuberosum]